MPTYVYESKTPCPECGGTFEVQQTLADEALERCPTCQKQCRKIISPFSLGKPALGFDVSKAKESGMSVLKRRDKGVYEKL